jgi:uncharacterized lipoprotein YajG
MMTRYIPFILVLFITGCATQPVTPPQTPAQALFDSQIYLNGALASVEAYVKQPDCVTDKTIAACADPDAKDALKKESRDAVTALKTAKTVLAQGGKPDIDSVRAMTAAVINELYARGKLQ